MVYKEEYKKLTGTKYAPKIDQSKALDPANGYDILSYTIDGTPLHIEVKTTTVDITSFYLSDYELETAKRMKKEGLIYVVYFIKEIMSNNPRITVIEDIAQNPSYQFKELSWKVTERENL